MDKEINETLTRGVEKVLPDRESLAQLMAKKKIKLYQGFDPTGGRLHLGHSIGLRKLMQFANLGHEVIFLFGTGTVLVGDPSQRDTGRKLIADEEIDKNIKTWKKQVKPIVDFSKIKILKNGDWLTKLTIKDIINIGSKISAIQLFKRESFQNRLIKGDTVWFHETLYPLLQGYDSVHMNVDLEVGGTDQEFNMLIGRELLKKMKQKEKYVLTIPMITGTNGKQMSKSSGNCIWMDDPADEKFGKTMACLDEQIIPYMTLLTNIPLTEVNEIAKELKSGKLHPLHAKKRLAHEIVTMWHNTKEADQAQDKFEKTFQKGKPSYKVTVKYSPTVCDIVASQVLSTSQAKRLIAEGGVSVNEKQVKNPKYEIRGGEKIKIGKKNFVTVKNPD